MKAKKLICTLLAVLMLVSVMPLSVFAAGQQQSPQVKFGNNSGWITDMNYEKIDGVTNFYYDSAIDMYVIVLENYVGGGIVIAPDEDYFNDSGNLSKNDSASVKIVFKGKNKIEPIEYKDSYYGIYNASNFDHTSSGGLVLEGEENASLTISRGYIDGDTEKDIDFIYGIAAGNLRILSGNIGIEFGLSFKSIRQVFGIEARWGLLVDNSANLNIKIDAKSAEKTEMLEASGIVCWGYNSENYEYKARPDIRTDGKIEISVFSNNLTNLRKTRCSADPFDVTRSAGKSYASIFLMTNDGGTVIESSMAGDIYEPANYLSGGEVAKTKKELSAWTGVDKNTVGALKTVDVNEIYDAVPVILKGKAVKTRIETAEFVGILKWVSRNGADYSVISSYDEIKSGSKLYLTIIPKLGYTWYGIKANSVKIPFADVINNADNNFVTATFKYAIDPNEEISVKLVDKDGKEYGTDGIIEADVGETVELYAKVVGNTQRTAKPEGGNTVFKWYRMDVYRLKTTGQLVPLVIPAERVFSPLGSSSTDNMSSFIIGSASLIEGSASSDRVRVASYIVCTARTLGSAVTIPSKISDKLKLRQAENSVCYDVEIRLPVITKQPVSVTVNEGDDVSFSVAAKGNNLKYQWYFASSEDGINWRPWTDNASLVGADLTKPEIVSSKLSKLHYSGKIKLKCVISNEAGSVETDEVTVYIKNKTAPAPEITKQPAGVTVTEGEKASFSIAAKGESLSYRWYKNGKEISGANGATYSFNASLADNGAKFKCTVSNEGGSVTSAEVTLTVNKKAEEKPMLLMGNVNGDGKDKTVTVADARTALRAAVGLETLSGIKLFLANVDGTAGISVGDARLILRMAVKLDALQYSNKY